MTPTDDILAEARQLAQQSMTWADLSNALFDPVDGLVARRLPDHAARTAFRKTDDYVALYNLLEQKIRETGVLAGAEPQKSGRFVVRLPRSLHAALEREAAAEGTSLNQLVVAKLALGLGTLVSEHGARPNS